MSNLLNFNIFTGDISDISFDGGLVINTINPHSYYVSKKDIAFQKALESSDILLPDGIGIVWAVKFLHGKKIKKIAGYDIFHHLMCELNKNGGTCFFLGSSENVLYKIQHRAKVDFPNIKIDFYSPPYKVSFSEEDNVEIIKIINKNRPEVLFVGMTAPKQEKWVYENRKSLQGQIICSIGAVFDFYAGTIKRSNPFWINIGLEWLPRFVRQPRKLWKRIFISNPMFMFYVFKSKWGDNIR
jgi:N-acetylglucosaminyldiphosphoundecaprenol N-acetyl-beta-D-mannosaminyltransferase